MEIAILWDHFKVSFLHGYIPGMTKDKSILKCMFSFDLSTLIISMLLLIKEYSLLF